MPLEMRLSRPGDYSLRILIFLALRDAKLTKTVEIAAAYGISRGHGPPRSSFVTRSVGAAGMHGSKN
jgi:hypothetical protein